MTSDSDGCTRRWTFFISYAVPDRIVADQLYELLARESTVFLDHRSLPLGADWDLSLAEEQRCAAATLVLVSLHTVSGLYQREEIVAAIKMSRKGAHRVIPIWLTGNSRTASVPFGLGVKQGIEVPASGDLTDVARRLLDDYSPSAASARPTTVQSEDCIVMRLPLDLATGVENLAFSPNGRHIAIGSRASCTASIWAFPEARETLRLAQDGPVGNAQTVRQSGINSLAFSPDSRAMVTACGCKLAADVWEITSGQRLYEIRPRGGRQARVAGVAFGSKGYVATASNVRSVAVWDGAGRLARTLKHGFFACVHHLAITCDGRFLASAGDFDRTARVWELSNGTLSTVISPGGYVWKVAISLDGKTLITASAPAIPIDNPQSVKLLRCWDLTRTRGPVNFAHRGPVCDLALNPDGDTLATVDWRAANVLLWNARNGQLLRTLAHDGVVNGPTDVSVGSFS